MNEITGWNNSWKGQFMHNRVYHHGSVFKCDCDKDGNGNGENGGGIIIPPEDIRGWIGNINLINIPLGWSGSGMDERTFPVKLNPTVNPSIIMTGWVVTEHWGSGSLVSYFDANSLWNIPNFMNTDFYIRFSSLASLGGTGNLMLDVWMHLFFNEDRTSMRVVPQVSDIRQISLEFKNV